MVAGPNPAEGSITPQILTFVVKEEENACLFFIFSVGFAGAFVLGSAVGLGCWRVVACTIRIEQN
jgi:hypothetical protein